MTETKTSDTKTDSNSSLEVKDAREEFFIEFMDVFEEYEDLGTRIRLSISNVG